MKVLIYAAFLLSLGLTASAQESVTVQVYYESLCPDSIKWMVEQLDPTYEDLGQYMTVEFNPYGHAVDVANGDGYVFECQHGPNECTGNLYQACLLDKTDQGDLQVDAITCIMGSEDPHLATEACMTSLNIVDPSYEEVDTCHASSEGENILHQYGLETHSLDPEVTWVPWVTINDVFVEEDFDATQFDLKNLLCTKYLAGVPECQ